jgi:hypothetical protein
LPHPVRCAFRFSQPLSALLLRSFPALFRAGYAPGVPTLQSFHPTSSLVPLSEPNALLPLPCLAAWLDFKAFSRTQSRHHTCRIRAYMAACSPGFYPLQGLFPPNAAPPKGSNPFLDLLRNSSSPTSQRPPTFFRVGESATLSRVEPALLRFATSLPCTP